MDTLIGVSKIQSCYFTIQFYYFCRAPDKALVGTFQRF